MAQYKSPSRIQVEAIECGAVSLWIVLGSFKKWISIEEARRAVHCSKDGTNAQQIVDGLKSYGVDSDGYELSIDELKDPSPGFPLILWVHRTHWVVLDHYQNGFFYISDPANGYVKQSFDELKANYSGLALSAKPTSNFRPGGTRPIPLFEVIGLLRHNKTELIAYILTGIVISFPTIALSSFVGYFSDTLINQSSVSNSYIWLLALLVGVFWGLTYLRRILLRRIHLSLLLRLLEKTFAKIIGLPVDFFPLRDTGELSQRMGLPINLSNLLTGPLADAAVGLVTLIIYGLVLISYNPFLGLTVIAFGSIIFISMISVSEPLSKLAQKTSMATGRMTSNVLTMISRFKFLKQNGVEQQLYQRWADNFSFSQDASQQSSEITRRNSAVTSYLKQLADYLIVIISGIFVIAGAFSVGDLLSFRLISLAFLAPISQLTQVNGQFNSAVGDINRLKDLWDNEDDKAFHLDFIANEYSIIDDSLRYRAPKLDINGISVLIPGGGQEYVIKNSSFFLNPGTFATLSGSSGSGKSLLLNCLAGISVPSEGTVTYSGCDMLRLASSKFSSCVGYVNQYPHLFDTSLLGNITMSDSSIPIARVQNLIHSLDFKFSFDPDNRDIYSKSLTDLSLSEIDKNQLFLLRSLVRKPKILIVDDIFQSSDPDFVLQLLRSIQPSVFSLLLVSNNETLVSSFPTNFFISNQQVFNGGSSS